MSEWVGGNMSDKELNDGTAEVERLRDRLRELMDRFEAVKLAALRGILTPRAAFLNNTAAELRALGPAARKDVLISVERGGSTSARRLDRSAKGRPPAGRP